MNIEDVARSHLADALSGKMQHCVVSEWIDDGEPVKVYWQPLTGVDQQRIREDRRHALSCWILRISR